MTYRRMVRNLVPASEPDIPEAAIFPVAVVPFALAALESRIPRFIWADDSYYRGVQLIRSLQLALLQGGLADLVEGQNRLYRLLDSAFYGREYAVETAEPLVIVPEIPAVPDVTAEPAGLVAMIDQLPGILDPGWFGLGGRKAQIADVVAALRVGDPEQADSIISQLSDILGATGSAAQIGELVAELFSSGVEAAADGGIFLLLAAASIGNLSAMGALSVQLARITKALDGGALVPPTDNILVALRGIDTAGEERNVIDASSAITVEKIDEMIAKLEAIRLELV